MRRSAGSRFIPSYVWFFAKLSVLLFVFIWIRGTLPRMRVDHVMNFAWKFMLPMAFTCVIAAAVWHFQARGLRGLALVVRASSRWFISALSRLLDTKKKFRAAHLSFR